MCCFQTTFRIAEGTQKGETLKAHFASISTKFTEGENHSDTATLSMPGRDQNELLENVQIFSSLPPKL